jgi:Fe-S-cluster containining protein
MAAAMRKATLNLNRILTTALLVCAAIACGDPCSELADKVCDCQITRVRESSCSVATSVAERNMDLSGSEDDRCQAILDSGKCTCEALAGGDTSVCGLSNDATVALEQ